MTSHDESSRSRPRRRLPTLVLLAAVVGAAALTLLPRLDGTRLDPMAARTSMAMNQAPTQADIRRGKEVFLRDCAWCHGKEGDGSQYAPSLKDVGTAAADFMLRTGRMPLQGVDQPAERGPAAYDPATIDAIDAYVATFTEGPPKPSMEPGTDVYEGRSLFLENCAPCHGASGTGMIVTNGAFAPELFPDSPQEVGDAVRTGPSAMPGFTDKEIDADQLNNIASYVQQLGDKQAIGGDPIDQFGPIVEGIVAWLIPLPVLLIIIRLMGKKRAK